MEWARRIHQNRLVQIAREGASTHVAHLREFSMGRRCATLVATVLDTATILIDETLEMHERILGKYFKKAERRAQTPPDVTNLPWTPIRAKGLNVRTFTGESRAKVRRSTPSLLILSMYLRA